MRCNDCNKFVSNDDSTEPEIDNLEVDNDGNVTASVRIVNTCADCGTDLSEATLEMDTEVLKAAEHAKTHSDKDEDEQLEVEESGSERIGKFEGKGRGRRTFYGAAVDVEVSCTCGKFKVDARVEGYEQASAMNDCR